jgi:hypothetical protein
MYVKVCILILVLLLVLSIKQRTASANHESPLNAQREMKLSEIQGVIHGFSVLVLSDILCFACRTV